MWKCYGKHDRPKFSLKVGTIFEDSPLSLAKWLPAVWIFPVVAMTVERPLKDQTYSNLPDYRTKSECTLIRD